MIRPPAGFGVRLADGAVVFESRDGACTLEYVERLRPVPSIEALWGDAPSTTPPRRFVTDEGEYAWILDGAEGEGDAFAGRVLGAVIGDDFLAVLDARSRKLDVHRGTIALVEQLLRADSHMLGIRRRPYWHAAPDGWAADSRDPFFMTYNREDARIVVSPAIPRVLGDRDAVVAALHLPPDAVAELVTHPFTGTRWSAVTDRCIEAFVLEDGEYFYPAVAESTVSAVGEVERALAGVMASIEPIPRPKARMFATLADGAFRRAITMRL